MSTGEELGRGEQKIGMEKGCRCVMPRKACCTTCRLPRVAGRAPGWPCAPLLRVCLPRRSRCGSSSG